MIQKLDFFPTEDGHIESILIGVDCVKVSFQTWDSRKLVLIYKEVENIRATHAVYEDIGNFHAELVNSELSRFIFYSAWEPQQNSEQEVLLIEAKEMNIYQVGLNADINSAVFDVGYEYIGNQNCPYINSLE